MTRHRVKSQKPIQPKVSSSVVQTTTTVVTCQALNTQSAPTVVPSSNIKYVMTPSSRIVPIKNVDSKQLVFMSNTQRGNTGNFLRLGTRAQNTTTIRPISSGTVPVSKNLGITTSASSTIQRPSVSTTRPNTVYCNLIKGTVSEPSTISIRSKPIQLKPSASYILTSNNVPISSLQNVTSYVRLPLIQKPKTMLTTNVVKPNVNFQHQFIRPVIVPNLRTASVSQQQSTNRNLALNSINVTSSQVLNLANGNSNLLNTNIQHLNTKHLQLSMAQKPRNKLNCTNLKPNTEISNIKHVLFGQQTIQSSVLPANHPTVVASPQQKVLKNVPRPPRFVSPKNVSIQNATVRPSSKFSARSKKLPIRAPITWTPKIETPRKTIFADSKIVPIPLGNRKNQLVVSKKSIKICVDEINDKHLTGDQPYLNLTEPALELIQAEVTYRLFYLLRECKKVLLKSRSSVLTEESVRNVCAEYFATFYGNKLWPLFCLVPNEDDDTSDEDRVWTRKHNNVNLIAWLKHPKFQRPSYIKKRRLIPLPEKKEVSEAIIQSEQPTETNVIQAEIPLTAKSFFQSFK